MPSEFMSGLETKRHHSVEKHICGLPRSFNHPLDNALVSIHKHIQYCLSELQALFFMPLGGDACNGWIQHICLG